MSLFEIILLLLTSVLLSSIISQISDKISTPLVQIAIGFIIALAFDSTDVIDIDSELFLLLFIAPLLFNESRHIDRLGFWENKGLILSLALGLVIITTLVIGFVTNLVYPSIALAAAFALGAALGPTDAVAVTSMGKNASLTDKQKSILSGECLLNDASGLVAFQFSIAAAMTGEFSLASAGVDFLFKFFGGIIFGALAGLLLNWVNCKVKDFGLEDKTFHILFDILVPFIVYLLAEELNFSGVLAVVASGVVFSITNNTTGPQTSKMSIASNSVWETISFVLNGIVFVLLGMMLPGGMVSELENETKVANFDLLVVAVIVTACVIIVRFFWAMINEKIFNKGEITSFRELLRHSAILTFSGAKGAVTLVIVMTIDKSLDCRNDIVFVASVAIVITLLLANFVIPILAKPKTSDLEARKQQEYMDAYIKALRESIRALENDMEKAVVVHERLAYQTVIEEQSKLIIELKDKYNIYNDDDKDIQELYAKTLQWQIEYIEEMQKEPSTAKRFSKKTLDGFKKRLKTSKKNCLHSNIVTKSMQNMVSSTITLTRMFKNTVTSSDDELDESSRLKVACASYVLGKLSPRSKTRSCYKPEVIAVISNKYKKYIDFEKEEISITQTIKSNDNADEIRRRALYYQHQSADEQYADKEITRETLSRLRRQIAVMQIDLAEEI